MRALIESLQADYFRRALVEAALAGALGGLVSVHVLLRRLQFFVVALSHATFPGVVLASALGVSLFVGGSAFGLLVAGAVVLLGRERSAGDSSIVGVVVAGAFAFGVALITALPAGGRQLTAFLVGSIVTVDTGDVILTAAVLAVGVATCGLLHKELVFSAFDHAGAASMGYNKVPLDLVVLILVTLVSVSVIPAVGTLLAISLLTIPGLIARLWSDRVVSMMIIASIGGASAGVIGLCLSAIWNIAAGGAIALTGVGLLGVSLIVRQPRRWSGAITPGDRRSGAESGSALEA